MVNSTPDTPDVSETKLAALKMDELRSHARKLGIDGADELHKPELLAKVKDHHYAQAHGGRHRDGSGGGSSTGSSPSASELSSMKLGELREHARKLGIDGADELHKPELLAKVKVHHNADGSPSASELSSMKLGELREHARKLGIDGADELHKPELLAKVKIHHNADGSPSASELSSMKLGELREHARKLGIDGADELHKPELLAKLKDHHTTDSGGRRASSATRNRSGNSTPDTPDVSETKLAALKMDELRRHARKLGIDGADELHKPELLAKVKDHHYAQAHGGKHRPDAGEVSNGGAGETSSAKDDRSRNIAPATPETNETALTASNIDEPQEHARKPDIDGADEPAGPEPLATVDYAPNTAEDGHLSHQEEPPGIGYAATTTQTAPETAGTAGTTGTAATTGTTGTTGITGTADYDAGRENVGSTTNDGMTRSPGRLEVGAEAGSARLPEHVVSEHRRVSVPVVNEEVNLDREPTSDAHRGAAYDPPAISVRKPDVVLREERPVVDVDPGGGARPAGRGDPPRAGDGRR